MTEDKFAGVRWELYQRIANRYMYLAFVDDPEDLRQDIIVALERIDKINQYQASDSRLYYEARHVVQSYVRRYEKEKAVKRYDTTEEDELDDDGEPKLRIDEIVADREAPDLDAWLDAKEILRRLSPPKRLLDIAQRRVDGYTLTHKEEVYLLRYRSKLKPTYAMLKQG